MRKPRKPVSNGLLGPQSYSQWFGLAYILCLATSSHAHSRTLLQIPCSYSSSYKRGVRSPLPHPSSHPFFLTALLNKALRSAFTISYLSRFYLYTHIPKPSMKLSDLKSVGDGIYELKQGDGQDTTMIRIGCTRTCSNPTEEDFS
jgi:hypothetical protein